VVPGEDDRAKQYEEIQQLINSEPIVMPPDPMMVMQAQQTGMQPPPEQEIPSVEAEFDVDNHDLEADICRRWLVSDAGRLCKIENPPGYKNVLLHMKMHKDMSIQKQMQEMMQQAPPMGPPAEAGAQPENMPPEGPIQGDGNVPTIQ
jgi:hypothetical protein